METEQTRITGQLSIVNARLAALTTATKTVLNNLEAALELAANWHAAYSCANDRERRLLNQAIFEKIYITHQGFVTHDYAEPFDLLLGETVVRAAVEQVDAATLTTEQSQQIDEAWKELSALWKAAEDALGERLTKSGRPGATPDMKRTPEAMHAVGGSNVDLLVGAEGLEPPTSAL